MMSSGVGNRINMVSLIRTPAVLAAVGLTTFGGVGDCGNARLRSGSGQTGPAIRPARLALRRATGIFGDMLFVCSLGRATGRFTLRAVARSQAASPRSILHGILVGLFATLLYVCLTLSRPEPLAYLFAHVLKILGGAAGGFVAERRKTMRKN
jgi:hypothetical protein